jgi:hypothetical protein
MPPLQAVDQATQPQGIKVSDAAARIAGLLDDNGNTDAGNPSRLKDPDKGADRDQRGRFKAQAAAADTDAADEANEADDSDVTDEEEAPKRPAASEDDAEDTEDPDKADDASEPAGDPIETLEQLAAALEVPVADLAKQLKHTFKAAGQDVTATLEDLVAGYQMGADYRRDKSKLGEERRALEVQANARNQEFIAQSHQLAATFRVAADQLQIEANNPQLQQLRATDPAEFAARMFDLQARAARLQQAQQQAATHYEDTQKNHLRTLVQAESQRLSEAVPDWSEDKKGIVRKTMQTLGYSDEELGQVYDSRLIVGALELHALRAENAALKADKAKAADAVKRIKKDVPLRVRPGAQSGGKLVAGAKQLSKLRANLNKTRSVGDAAKLIERLI